MTALVELVARPPWCGHQAPQPVGFRVSYKRCKWLRDMPPGCGNVESSMG